MLYSLVPTSSVFVRHNDSDHNNGNLEGDILCFQEWVGSSCHSMYSSGKLVFVLHFISGKTCLCVVLQFLCCSLCPRKQSCSTLAGEHGTKVPDFVGSYSRGAAISYKPMALVN